MTFDRILEEGDDLSEGMEAQLLDVRKVNKLDFVYSSLDGVANGFLIQEPKHLQAVPLEPVPLAALKSLTQSWLDLLCCHWLLEVDFWLNLLLF